MAKRGAERTCRRVRSVWLAAVASCAVLLGPSVVLAQDAGSTPQEAEPPPLEGGDPQPEAQPSAPDAGSAEAGVAPTPAQRPAASPQPAAPAGQPDGAPPAVRGEAGESSYGLDNDGVFRAFAVYAASERDRRIVGAVAGVAAGVTTMVLGATIAEPTGTDPDVWYVVGGISAGLSLLGLIMPSPAESIARSFRVKEPHHSANEARALEIRWNDFALAAKRRRISGGAVSLLVSAVAIGSGVAIATGAGDFTDTDRYFWGTFLIASGAGLAVGGLASLVVKSPAERSYEAYRAVRPEAAGVSPLLLGGPGGVLVGARGSF